MPTTADYLPLVPFDPKNASDAEYAAVNAFENRMRAENWPDDPPQPLEVTIRRMQNLPTFIDIYPFLVWDEAGTQIVASGGAGIFRHDNLHAGGFQIEVLPRWRRRGLGRRILEKAVEIARAEDRTLLFANSASTVPAGEAFLRRIGAEPGLASHTNQLDLRDLDRGLLRAWQERAKERTGDDFEMGVWYGPYPEEAIEEVVVMKKAMQHAPRGDLKFEDPNLTPEILREHDALMVNRKQERWTVFVRERATGRIAGFTEIFYAADRPHILSQGETAVFPEYRNRGLGRWVKAAMLERVLSERPSATKVRTNNADSNAAMLNINTEMGFKPYRSETVWQVERATVEAYLAETA